MNFRYLLSPLTINQLQLKNRMVVSAMVTNYANADGTPTEKYIAYHETKARGGWGLIITENYTVARNGGGFVALPSLCTDELIEPHRELTDRVHGAGGKIIAQIYHAGRETTKEITGVQPIAPSAVKEPSMPETPRAMSLDEIGRMIERFADCALRVKKAGFDGVEIHGAHGYLIGSFVSPFSNKRTDAYGGSLENRARFAVEIVQKVRKKVGDDFPILYRMSTVEYVDGGLEIGEARALACMLEDAGVDCLHCSQGVYASTFHITPPAIAPKGHYLENAAAIKSVVNIPVIAAGHIADPEMAESILRSGKADLITMARASLADPYLPAKVMEGKTGMIQRCIGCRQGCAARNMVGLQVRCLVNPVTGMEDIYTLDKTAAPKKVLVAGGGVAGCMAAIAAAQRGHAVTLYEMGPVIGGQWTAAATPAGKADFASLICWQQLRMRELGVKVKLNQKLDRDAAEKEQPDAVIIATGAKPFIPPIQGVQNSNVVSAMDTLLGCVEAGKRVVVVGGGIVGAETADHLALHGGDVVIIEQLPQIAQEAEAGELHYLLQRLEKNGVEILTSAQVVLLGLESVTVEQHGKQRIVGDIDMVVMATGARPVNSLREELADLPCSMVCVGDAESVKNGYANIQQGFDAGYHI